MSGLASCNPTVLDESCVQQQQQHCSSSISAGDDGWACWILLGLLDAPGVRWRPSLLHLFETHWAWLAATPTARPQSAAPTYRSGTCFFFFVPFFFISFLEAGSGMDSWISPVPGDTWRRPT